MSKQTFLVEIGCEELPPKSLQELSKAFCDGVISGLDKAEIAHGTATVFATPRRLALQVCEVVTQQPTRSMKSKTAAIGRHPILKPSCFKQLTRP